MNEAGAASREIWPLSLRLAHWVGAILVLAALGLGVAWCSSSMIPPRALS
jgi:hypothetical protein